MRVAGRPSPKSDREVYKGQKDLSSGYRTSVVTSRSGINNCTDFTGEEQTRQDAISTRFVYWSHQRAQERLPVLPARLLRAHAVS